MEVGDELSTMSGMIGGGEALETETAATGAPAGVEALLRGAGGRGRDGSSFQS